MQNLESRYPSNSPQVEYLTTYHLLEDQQVDYRSDRDPFEIIQEELEFEEREIEQDEGKVSDEFWEFVRQSTGVAGWLGRDELIKKVEGMLLILAGDIFELNYHNRRVTSHRKNNQMILFQQHKWCILIHLFIVFLMMVLWPIQTFIIFCLLSIFITTTHHPSQLEQNQSLPKKLVQSSLRLKFFCLSHQKKIALDSQIPDKLISELIVSIQSSFNVEIKTTTTAFDTLDELIFHVNQKHKDRSLIQEFMKNESYLSLKKTYWQIRFYNYKLERAIRQIDKVIETIDKKVSSDVKISKKGFNYSDLYYSLFTKKIKELSIKEVPSQEQKIDMKKMMNILEKQICLKNISSGYQGKEPELKDGISNQFDEKDNFQIFVYEEKESDEPAIYEDGSKETYVAQDFAILSSRLQNVLKERQRKQQEEKRQKEEPIQQDMHPTFKERQTLERRSFGIPLIPPARDMAAYYLE